MAAPSRSTECGPTELTGQIDELAARGLRVLAFAHRELSGPAPRSAADVEQSLVFLGLVGLEDPIRPEVPAAIERCEVAGIRVVMITGDHPNTARERGACRGDPGGHGSSSARSSRTTTTSCAPLLEDEKVGVLARIAPEQKLRIVRSPPGGRRTSSR